MDVPHNNQASLNYRKSRTEIINIFALVQYQNAISGFTFWNIDTRIIMTYEIKIHNAIFYDMKFPNSFPAIKCVQIGRGNK